MDGSIQLPDDSILAAMLMFCCSQKKNAHVLDGLHVSIGSDPIARGATAADSVAA